MSRRRTIQIVEEERDDSRESHESAEPEDIVNNGISLDIDIERMANELVRYILFSEQARSPIRRTNILKNIISDTISLSAKSKVYKEIFSIAQVKLRDVFGMELVPLPPREYPQDELVLSMIKDKKRPNKKVKVEPERQIRDDATDMYILKTILPEAYRQQVSDMKSKKEQEFFGYVFIFCSIILLHEKGYIEKSDLITNYLYPLGFTSTNIEIILTKLAKYQYLISKTIKDVRGDKRLQYFSLGQRTKVEFKDNEGFKEICNLILGDKYSESTSEQINLRLKSVNMLTVPTDEEGELNEEGQGEEEEQRENSDEEDDI